MYEVLEESFLAAGLGYVGSLRALGALNNFKFDGVAFLQGSVSIPGYRGIMNEDVRSVIPSDEPISFGVVEPLDCSLHEDLPSWP
jgi:hypothetical protein